MIKRKDQNIKLRKFARENRNNPTFAEAKLWKLLNNKQFYGFKFTRQKVILNYIVDFYCSTLELAIEIDGSSHDEKKFHYDIKRHNNIENLGIEVIRFTEHDVMRSPENVMQTLENWLIAKEYVSHTP